MQDPMPRRLSTKAVKTDGGYILNGTKLYVTSGGVADIYAVMVRTDEAQKQKGITAMVVEDGDSRFFVRAS